MPDVVEDARSPLLEVTGAFALRVVVLDMRIKKVFVKHIVETSVDVDCLVNNGGIVGCGCSEGGRGDGGGLSKGSDGEGKGSEDLLQRHKPLTPNLPSPLLTFEVLVGLGGYKTTRLARAYVNSGLVYVRATVLSTKTSDVGQTAKAATDFMRV
jgi:hypothetical protein